MLFTQLSETIPSLIFTLMEMFVVRVDSLKHMDTVLMGTGPVSRSSCELVGFFALLYKTSSSGLEACFYLGSVPLGSFGHCFFSGNYQMSFGLGSMVISLTLLLA